MGREEMLRRGVWESANWIMVIWAHRLEWVEHGLWTYSTSDKDKQGHDKPGVLWVSKRRFSHWRLTLAFHMRVWMASAFMFSWEGSLLAYFPRNLGAHGVGTNCLNFQQLLNRKGERTFDSLYDMYIVVNIRTRQTCFFDLREETTLPAC